MAKYKSKLVLAREALVKERAEELRVFILKKIGKSKEGFSPTAPDRALEMACIMIAEAEMEVS